MTQTSKRDSHGPKRHEFKFRKTDLDHDLIWFALVLMNIKTPLPFGKVQPLSGGVSTTLINSFRGTWRIYLLMAEIQLAS